MSDKADAEAVQKAEEKKVEATPAANHEEDGPLDEESSDPDIDSSDKLCTFEGVGLKCGQVQ